MIDMRAKMRVYSVKSQMSEGVKFSEVLHFTAVSRSEGYDENGADENNTYAVFTPTADVSMTVANPALFDKFVVDEEYYVDFTSVNG